jgi:hypothetical protein
VTGHAATNLVHAIERDANDTLCGVRHGTDGLPSSL